MTDIESELKIGEGFDNAQPTAQSVYGLTSSNLLEDESYERRV